MKKSYNRPFAEKIEFDYTSQVVAQSSGSSDSCTTKWVNSGTPCSDQSPYSVITPNPQ